jgi:Protein of unknown function (DUF3891)
VIVKPTKLGWEIIYHRAHALLAAQIAGQWQREKTPARLHETISAISHHDDLEKEWEECGLTEAGAPMDFTLNSKTSYPQLRKHLESSLYRGRWVAMLNSMHMSFLQEGHRGESAEGDDFLDEQLANQQQWREELEITKDEAQRAYDFMQWCDRLSLILCQGQVPEDSRELEISKGPDGRRYSVKECSNGKLTVIPWCFKDDEFVVNVEVSDLSEVKFEDNPTLIAALKQSPRRLLEWTFVKQDM